MSFDICNDPAKANAVKIKKRPAKPAVKKAPAAKPVKTFTIREIDSWVMAGRRYNP